MGYTVQMRFDEQLPQATVLDMLGLDPSAVVHALP